MITMLRQWVTGAKKAAQQQAFDRGFTDAFVILAAQEDSAAGERAAAEACERMALRDDLYARGVRCAVRFMRRQWRTERKVASLELDLKADAEQEEHELEKATAADFDFEHKEGF